MSRVRHGLNAKWWNITLGEWIALVLAFIGIVVVFCLFFIRRQVLEYRLDHTFTVHDPEFIGSALALASPDIPARILLNGKEGPIGLMPPVGSVLSDDQIAAVLTYVRREWGQSGTAVEPEAVKTIRTLTAGRTRPWTNDELMALVDGRGRRP